MPPLTLNQLKHFALRPLTVTHCLVELTCYYRHHDTLPRLELLWGQTTRLKRKEGKKNNIVSSSVKMTKYKKCEGLKRMKLQKLVADHNVRGNLHWKPQKILKKRKWDIEFVCSLNVCLSFYKQMSFIWCGASSYEPENVPISPWNHPGSCCCVHNILLSLTQWSRWSALLMTQRILTFIIIIIRCL